MDNDLDRDLAKKINDMMSDCLTLVQTINDNKFVPHILTQPVDVESATGVSVTFSIVANNVKGYQWQWKLDGDWTNSGSASAKTDTFSVSVTGGVYNVQYRCAITGLDNSIIYSDIVKVLRPST